MPLAIQTSSLRKQFPQQSGWREMARHPRVLFKPDLTAPAVDGVDLEVKEGELFGLLGPNGAGKTTLIKMLATLIVPTSGSARVNSFNLGQETAIKASIGLVTSDERSFYWRLSGRENLEFFASLHGLPPERIPDQVAAVLSQVGLQEVAGKRFQTYSTGMRQRLSIARALLNGPRLLFLDEPTKGLDPQATRDLHKLIREELTDRQSLTVFLTTHHLEEAELLCDRIAIMHRGRIRACGSLEELRQDLNLNKRYQIQVSGLHPEISSRLGEHLKGLRVDLLGNRAHLIEFESLNGDGALNEAIDILRDGFATIQDVSHHKPSLEAIFTHLVEEAGSPAEDTKWEAVASRKEGHASQPGSANALSPHTPSRPLQNPLRIAWAFFKRDWRSEASYRLSFFLQFFGILFSVAVFYFVSQLLGNAAAPYLTQYGGDYFSFVLIGIAFAGYFGVGLSSFSNSLRQSQTTGTLEAMLTTPTSLSAIVLASSLWDYLQTTLRVLVYLAVGAVFLGVDLGKGNYPAALVILILTIVAFSSLGIIAASFIMVLKRGDPITWLFSAASSLLGGVYYPIAVLPGWMQWFSKLLPITYSLQSMRLALLQGASFSALLPDIAALGVFAVLLLPISLLSFRYAVQRAKVDGSLTHY